MRIANIIVRSIIGLLLIFASATYFLDLVPQPKPEDLPKDIARWNDGAAATVYLMPLVKALELICGLLFLSGFYTALAAIVILPISVNAFLFHAFLAPESIAMAAVLLAGNLFLIYTQRHKYAAIFTR